MKPWRLDSWIPARCEVCGRWPARAVCTDCLAAFADRPARCGRCAGALTGSPEVAVPGAFCPQYPQCPHCRSTPPAFDACACAVAYAYPWDGVIARFKFEAQPGWAGPLAGLMAAHPRIAALLAQADAVLPVPLAPRRLAERGYNPAWELARRLAPRSRLRPRLLRRTRETSPQAGLERAQRRHNLAGAFAADPADAATIQGRHLLLVDDVMTSGATLHEAALALRRAGAGRVSAVALARTDLI